MMHELGGMCEPKLMKVEKNIADIGRINNHILLPMLFSDANCD